MKELFTTNEQSIQNFIDLVISIPKSYEIVNRLISGIKDIQTIESLGDYREGDVESLVASFNAIGSPDKRALMGHFPCGCKIIVCEEEGQMIAYDKVTSTRNYKNNVEIAKEVLINNRVDKKIFINDTERFSYKCSAHDQEEDLDTLYQKLNSEIVLAETAKKILLENVSSNHIVETTDEETGQKYKNLKNNVGIIWSEEKLYIVFEGLNEAEKAVVKAKWDLEIGLNKVYFYA